MFEAIKIILSAIIIFIASEVAKKSVILGSIVVSLPLMSLLTIMWLYVDTKDTDRIATFSYSCLLYTSPSPRD